MFREVARKKQSLSFEKIKEVLTTEKRGVLAVNGDNGYPYGVPMNFWYNEINGNIYFHSGKKGHKNDSISANNKVSFCVYDSGYKMAGEWALNVNSVIVFGKLSVVDDIDEISRICRSLSLKYTTDFEYIENEIKNFVNATICYELVPEHITGKLVNES